jgi:hypothetical protein
VRRGRAAVLMPEERHEIERRRQEAIEKIAAQLDTPEQRAALSNLAAGEGEPVALARVLRPVPHLLLHWPLDATLLAKTVWALGQLPDEILIDVEGGGMGVERAVFLLHYARRLMLDSPERRADFQRRAVAALKALGAAQSGECGSLSHLSPTAALLHRCPRCDDDPAPPCELRIVEEVASTVLDEQKADQRRVWGMTEWDKPIWTVWNVLSWIVFRQAERICAVVHENEFNAESRHDNRWQSAKGELISELQIGRLVGVKGQHPLPPTHWYGVKRIDADTLFTRAEVIGLWQAEETRSTKKAGRQRLSERPINKKNGHPTTVTAAWDVMGLHPDWKDHGMPRHWTREKCAEEVTTYLRTLIRQGKIDTADYDGLKENNKDGYLISETSVRRALRD